MHARSTHMCVLQREKRAQHERFLCVDGEPQRKTERRAQHERMCAGHCATGSHLFALSSSLQPRSAPTGTNPTLHPQHPDSTRRRADIAAETSAERQCVRRLAVVSGKKAMEWRMSCRLVRCTIAPAHATHAS